MKEEILTVENFHYNTSDNVEDNRIVYFDFEVDFVDDNIRCIPMCVRFKLDACGIKLQLKEWSKMSVIERNNLASEECTTDKGVQNYREYLKQIIFNHTKNEATELLVEINPEWRKIGEIPQLLIDRLEE